MRHLAATLTATHHRRRQARRNAWAYFGSFGDDCFDDDDDPAVEPHARRHRPVRHDHDRGLPVLCRRTRRR